MSRFTFRDFVTDTRALGSTVEACSMAVPDAMALRLEHGGYDS